MKIFLTVHCSDNTISGLSSRFIQKKPKQNRCPPARQYFFTNGFICNFHGKPAASISNKLLILVLYSVHA